MKAQKERRGALSSRHPSPPTPFIPPLIQVEQALEHPYLASLHDLSDEPACSNPLKFDFDSETLTPDSVRCWS